MLHLVLLIMSFDFKIVLVSIIVSYTIDIVYNSKSIMLLLEDNILKHFILICN